MGLWQDIYQTYQESKQTEKQPIPKAPDFTKKAPLPPSLLVMIQMSAAQPEAGHDISHLDKQQLKAASESAYKLFEKLMGKDIADQIKKTIEQDFDTLD